METLQMNITMEENSSLLTIMTILNKIKDRNLDDVFDNLQDIINLLKNYNVDLEDSIGIQVKLSFRESILSFQSIHPTIENRDLILLLIIHVI